MSIFRGSNGTSVYGGNFNAITYATRPSGIDRLMEVVSPNAFYDSDNRSDPPKCHPNTRVAVINKIIDWANGMSDTNSFMLWLYGPAGAGKTAIARKVAELLADRGLLLASFLFFRSDPKRNTMKPLVVNIAYRVATVIHGAREPINAVIEADPLILSYSIDIQLRKLVFEPLRLLVEQGYFSNRQFPRLIVIDGLDECLDKDSQANLVQLLSSSVGQYQLPLKFLLVSRPESHIKSAVAFAANGEQSTVSHLELNNDFQPDEDIRYFLTDKFREIKTYHPFCSGIPSFWPSKQQMDTLIRKASGQFIYASLAVRFINSTCNSPMRQLDIVLELRPPINHDLPFAELDALYTYILACSKSLDLVLGILGLYDVLINDSFDDILKFVEFVLDLEREDVCIYLSPLNSLLGVKKCGYNSKIVFHHTSFLDFLRSPERSKDYCINAEKSHSLIAQRILQLFTSDHGSACLENLNIYYWCFRPVYLVKHLTKSLWTPQLEHALERFSTQTYLDWIDQNYIEIWENTTKYLDETLEFPEKFLNYLEGKGKSGLYHHHCLCYLEHVMSSINSPPTREKISLIMTVAFILHEPSIALRSGIELASGKKICITLFGFNSAELKLFDSFIKSRVDSRSYRLDWDHFTPSERYNEPIMSHRLANVAISCMQYLHRCNSNTLPTQDHFLASLVTKSKQSPWLWRRRMRVISIGRRRPIRNHYGHKYSFPQNLRRSCQIFYSEMNQEQRIFYIRTLDLLYHTLRKAVKSDLLIRALSKPFIPSSAPLLFPRLVKRIRKAAAAYLKKFSPSNLDASSVEAGVRRSMQCLPQSNLISIDDDGPESSGKVFLTGRDATKKSLKQNIDHMVDAIYGPTGADPKILASVSAVFDHVDKVGTEIKTRQTTL